MGKGKAGGQQAIPLFTQAGGKITASGSENAGKSVTASAPAAARLYATKSTSLTPYASARRRQPIEHKQPQRQQNIDRAIMQATL